MHANPVPAGPTSVVVLAGGLSRRLGHDKRRLRLWGASGPTLLERTLGVVNQLCDEVVVVLNDPQTWTELPARAVPDAFPDGGALGGLYSGLQAAHYPFALVLACDMPLLSPALLGAMLARPRDYEALVPRAPTPGSTRNHFGVEPLHAIYSRACLGPIRACLEADQRQITAFFPTVRVSYVERDEIAAHDPHGRSFLNINTIEQLAELQALLPNAG